MEPNIQGIFAPNQGIIGALDLDTGLEVDKTAIRPKRTALKVVGSEIFYEKTNSPAGLIDSLKVRLINPALGFNMLGKGVDPIYPGVSGYRDTGTQRTAIPAEATSCTVTAIGHTVRFIIRETPTTIALSHHIRDSGGIIRPGEVLKLESREEMDRFAFSIDDTLTPTEKIEGVVAVTYNQ